MNPSSKVVYLTFDDGPIPECTPEVLDILAHFGVKATFFMVGENASRYPDILERVRCEGHSIGNHTFHHLRGFQHSIEDYINDVKKADILLHTSLFRPPHGRMKLKQKKALLNKGYTIFLWDVLPHDYNPRYNTEKLVSIIKQYTRNGSIITLHDSLKSKDRMLQALPLIIQYLHSEGYTLLPLPENNLTTGS